MEEAEEEKRPRMLQSEILKRDTYTLIEKEIDNIWYFGGARGDSFLLGEG